MLRWAREQMGISLAEVAHHFGRPDAIISAWEDGSQAPTYAQLEQLAYSLYKRPVAIFFFSEPPDEPVVRKSFRTLPDSAIEEMLADTRLALRRASAMQINLSELHQGRNPSRRIIFRSVKIDTTTTARSAAEMTRQFLGISLSDQIQWGSAKVALDVWRDAVQECGIYVFKRSFRQEDFFGFCLMDEEFPIIYLNNSAAHSRQVFTLVHELAHVILNVNSTTQPATLWPDKLVGDAKATEVFCNEFASELIVPVGDFTNQFDANISTEDLCAKLAKRYSVSREVIARKLLNQEKISKHKYESLALRWTEEFEEQKKRQKESGGGDYYATHATYLGRKYLQLAFSYYYSGRITTAELASYLSVKARNVSGLEKFITERAPA